MPPRAWRTREFPHQVVLDGRVAGSWRRKMTAARATIKLKLYKPLDKRRCSPATVANQKQILANQRAILAKLR